MQRFRKPGGRLVPRRKRQILVLALVVRSDVEVDLVWIRRGRVLLKVHGLHREGGVPRLTTDSAGACNKPRQ